MKGWLDYPIRRTYNSIIKTPLGDIVLVYEQATLRETMDFLNGAVDIEEWVYDVLFKKSIFKKKKWWHRKKNALSYLFLDMDNIAKTIINKRFVGLDKKQKKGGRSVLFSAICQLICENYNITIKELFDDYTWEQYERMIEGVIFNINEQSKEGQRENDRMFRRKKSDKSDDELLRMLKEQQLKNNNK